MFLNVYLFLPEDRVDDHRIAGIQRPGAGLHVHLISKVEPSGETGDLWIGMMDCKTTFHTSLAPPVVRQTGTLHSVGHVRFAPNVADVMSNMDVIEPLRGHKDRGAAVYSVAARRSDHIARQFKAWDFEITHTYPKDLNIGIMLRRVGF